MPRPVIRGSAVRSTKLAPVLVLCWLAAVALARNEAIRSAHGAQLCVANAAVNGCAAADSDWGTSGWVVWVNNDADPAFASGVDNVVRVRQPDQTISLVASGTGALQFDGRGRPNAARTFTLQPDDCPQGKDWVRTIAVNTSGQTSSTRGTCP